jgi:hypothetical protein
MIKLNILVVSIATVIFSPVLAQDGDPEGVVPALNDPSATEEGNGDLPANEPQAVSASSGPYSWGGVTLGEGGGVVTNGSIGVVGQSVVGRMVSAGFTLDVGMLPTLSFSSSVPPDDGSDLVVWMSFNGTTVIPGLGSVEDEDIVAYESASGTWSMVFDGSDVGLAGVTIDGMARDADGNILLSFTSMFSLARNFVDDSDIVRFTPTSLGATTTGSFSFLLDASDVGLTYESEDVDAIDVADDGRVIVSTSGPFDATGASGGGEDLVVFNATAFGLSTFGSFAMYLDGSDVGLTTADESIDGAAHTLDGTILISTEGLFLVTGASGDDEDVVEFTPDALGSTTAGSYSLLLDLSTLGISGAADLGSLEVIR